MAILQNLKKILEAVYGKDVRQAIHDAIYECYEDGHAGSVDLVARSGIDALAANLNTEYGSEVLYEDSTGAKQIGAEITLADDYDEFDYLDIYTYTTARDEVHTVSTAYASVSLRIPNIVNSDSSYTPTTTLLLDELTLGFSGNKIVVSDHVQWKWTGAADAAATRTSIDSDVAQTTSIRKIVGRKIAANGEVEDIRTGYDGTEYESAGEAVRSQISQCIGGGGGGLTEDVKQALLDCFAHVAWTDEQGQDYYDALEAALYPPADLVSISAVYTQSGAVYDNASLDDLKADLVVTATYDDSSTDEVDDYILSGTLTVGTSTITVSYGDKTDTFTVTVTEHGWVNNVYTLTSDDFVQGKITVGYPYHDSVTNRISYVGLDITASSDYTYTVTYETTKTGTTNIGVQWLKASGYAKVLQHETLANDTTDKGDSSWQSSGYTLPQKSDIKCLWLCFRAGSGSTNIVPSDFPTVTITRTAVV